MMSMRGTRGGNRRTMPWACFVVVAVFWLPVLFRPASIGPKHASVYRAAKLDVSPPLIRLTATVEAAISPECDNSVAGCGTSPVYSDDDQGAKFGSVRAADPKVMAAGAAVEQSTQGTKPPAVLLSSFDGLGAGFTGPQGTANFRNPSDNSLAVGPDHIVQTVNSRMAVFTKEGKALYGPVVTNTIFAGFGGQCEKQVSGDSVVRYDQLAQRWLYVLPVFKRPPGEPAGTYSMCYAISTGADPLGPYYRYEFKRPLFPDYPRPAIWPDGYYVPSSTGDEVIQKHACVADRTRMLQGLPATEQCIVIDGPNFLNNADIDGQNLPPVGAPNIMMAAGGTQLRNRFEDDGIYVYKFHVDWDAPSKTSVSEALKIPVAPYHYLCNGQLTNCVPQPDTTRRLDAQGDKLMQRLVYRNINGRESIVGLHSIDTSAGGGGVRWYEFRLAKNRDPYLYQQGTYAPDGFYRWMGSIGMDRQGNIGVGYSFGGTPHFAGQRFAARLADDPTGALTLHETVLVDGAASQTSTMRWEDYSTTAMDPSDDCTFWYVGDYLKKGVASYTSRIGAFRLPGCLRGTVSGTVYFDRNHDGQHNAGEPAIPGRQVKYRGGANGKLLTDAGGAFNVSLPADPAYFESVYTISVPGSKPRIVPLKNRDNITGIDFGYSCTVPNTGGENMNFWSKKKGQTLLKAHDPAWRDLINSKLSLLAADGSRFTVPPSGKAAYKQLSKWLRHDSKSVQLFVTAINVAVGNQDASLTVHDGVAGDWIDINTLIKRASAATTASYEPVLASLNNNSAMVTPADPGKCSR